MYGIYADDTTVFTENERDLQTASDSVHKYCTKVITDCFSNITNIIIFSRGKVSRFTTLKYGCHLVEVVSGYIRLSFSSGCQWLYSPRSEKLL